MLILPSNDVEMFDTLIYHCKCKMFKVFISIVTIGPPGPLYLPISTQRNITCSVEGGTLSQFTVTFSNKDSTIYTPQPGTELVTGIVIIFADFTRFLISININDTSVTGIRCEGNLQTGNTITSDADTLDLTIYGEW